MPPSKRDKKRIDCPRRSLEKIRKGQCGEIVQFVTGNSNFCRRGYFGDFTTLALRESRRLIRLQSLFGNLFREWPEWTRFDSDKLNSSFLSELRKLEFARLTNYFA